MTSSPWAAIAAGDRERMEQRVRMEVAQARADSDLLSEPWVQPILARVGAAIDPAFPDRTQHALAITRDVVSAIVRPRHPVHPRFTRNTSEPAGAPFGGANAGGLEEEEA